MLLDIVCPWLRWTGLKPCFPFQLRKVIKNHAVCLYYRAFHSFGLAKFAYGGPVLGTSQFLLLPQLAQKMMLVSKVVKIDSKIIISSSKYKSVTHSVYVKALFYLH